MNPNRHSPNPNLPQHAAPLADGRGEETTWPQRLAPADEDEDIADDDDEDDDDEDDDEDADFDDDEDGDEESDDEEADDEE